MIEFLNFIALRGPNPWTYRPVIEAWVDIGELEDSPSNTIPGFNERLTALLPSLVEHRCSYGERGGFLKRLEEGTWPAHILEHVTLELQNLAGMPGGFGKARSTSRRGVYKVAVRCWHEDITRQALHLGRDLVMAAIEARPFDVRAAVARLAGMADDLLPGPSTRSIVEAATAKTRRIPAIRLNEGSLMQLGYGVMSHRIWTAETDATSAIAESISKDKKLTNSLLRSCGVPVPQGEVVKNAEDAWPLAEDIGLPVTVKPVDGNHGRGVSVDLSRREDIEAAFVLAREAARNGEVLIEQFIPGVEHRLLVVGGKLVAAARGEEAWVVGDGVSRVAQLIDAQINTDPRRGEGENFPLNLIHDDPAVELELIRQGSASDAVPAAGARLRVQRNGNVAADCTDEVHPETAALAALAARVVGLDIAGIDLVAADISRPLAGQRGALIEVNAGPGLLAHLKPASGKPRPVGEAIVDHLFPAGTSSRIPLAGVSGSHGASTVATWLHHILRLTGKTVGLATPHGARLGEQALRLPALDAWQRAQQLLTNRALEAAVIATPPASIVSEGLAYDRCQIGVVTGFDPQALLPDYHIDDPDRLYAVLRTQVDVVLPGGSAVLNAACPELVEMAALSDGDVIFFAGDESVIPAAPARMRGAVFLRDGAVVLREGAEEVVLAALAALPAFSAKVGADETTAQHEGAGQNPARVARDALQGGQSKDAQRCRPGISASRAGLLAVADGETAKPGRSDCLLAVIAAAWALGLPHEMIRTGLMTLDSAPDSDQSF